MSTNQDNTRTQAAIKKHGKKYKDRKWDVKHDTWNRKQLNQKKKTKQ